MHPSLPPRIVFDVGTVVVEEIALNLDLAGLIEKVKFVRPEIRVVACYVRVVTSVAASRRLKRQEICAQRAFIRRAIRPESSSCFPICPQTRIVGHCVLDDERFDSLRMRQGHAKTDRATVVLHVKSVVREPKSFGEV